MSENVIWNVTGKDWHASEAAHEGRIAAILGLKSGKKALDVGCGVGGPMRTIASTSGAHVTGITINDYQVKRAKYHNQKVSPTGALQLIHIRRQCPRMQQISSCIQQAELPSVLAASNKPTFKHCTHHTSVTSHEIRLLCTIKAHIDRASGPLAMTNDNKILTCQLHVCSWDWRSSATRSRAISSTCLSLLTPLTAPMPSRLPATLQW